MISIDVSFVLVILNFLLLIYLLKSLLYKPLMKFLEERQQQIAQDISSAEADKAKAREFAAEKEDELKAATAEAGNIRNAAKRKAEDNAAEIIRQAKDREKKILTETDAQIEHERKKALETIQGDLAGLVSALSAKVLQKEIDSDLDEELIKRFLSEKR
ncbi:MAG: ATP synthase F0 subunit B [Candidatus Cloacimonadota bacterium]|nr:MAG: ATP synthase F0 subunit B [Candidatus Cloacimonadota bacterium]